MKVEVKNKDGRQLVNEENVHRINITVDDNEWRIHWSPIYGLIVNKVTISDEGTDTLTVNPRTSNEICLK